MSKSNAKRTSRKAPKPPKPDGFPLTPHTGGAWMKNIQNPVTGAWKIHYFGRWGRIVDGKMERLPGDGRQAALKLWNAQKDDLLTGREPRVKSLDDLNEDGTLKENPDVLTMRQLCNRFLISRDRKLRAGELSAYSRQEYQRTTDLLIANYVNDQERNTF